MITTAPEELRALLARAGLSLDAAAALCGVTGRTMRNWRDGKSRVSADAMRTLEAAAADAAPPPDSEEARAARLSLLRDVAREQYARVCRIEDELMEAQAEHRATQRRLNRMLAEELKGDIRDD